MPTPSTGCRSWPAFARAVIEAAACQRDYATTGLPPQEARAHSGVFVTLHKFRRLRGCMGMLDPHMPIAEAIRQAAVLAALQDPRFPPVGPSELKDLDIEVSILSAPRRMESLADLVIGQHGILVRRGDRRGLFLPQVAVEHRLDKETFLARCCDEKAGLSPEAWKDPATEVLLFTTDVLCEAPFNPQPDRSSGERAAGAE